MNMNYYNFYDEEEDEFSLQNFDEEESRTPEMDALIHGLTYQDVSWKAKYGAVKGKAFQLERRLSDTKEELEEEKEELGDALIKQRKLEEDIRNIKKEITINGPDYIFDIFGFRITITRN